MSKISTVKVMGLQRTGTNLMVMMVQKNFINVKITDRRSGWKHGRYCAKRRIGIDPKLIVMVKHPLSWLASAYRWRGKKKFSRFNEYLAQTHEIEIWNAAYKHWLEVNIRHKIFVLYDDLIKDFQHGMDVIGLNLDLRMKAKNYLFIPNGRMGTDGSEQSKQFNPSYYLNQEYLKMYNGLGIGQVADRLDWDVVDKLANETGGSKEWLYELRMKGNEVARQPA